MNEMNQLSVSSALDTSHLDVKFPFKAKYGNFINGQWEAPKSGQYFDNTSPITGEVICQVARSNEEDINLALDAAHAAKDAWGRLSKRFAYLAPLAMTVEEAQVGGGTVYRLRASAGAQAATICGRLKVAGESCLLVN